MNHSIFKLIALTVVLGVLNGCGGSGNSDSPQQNTLQTPDSGTGTSETGNTGAENPDTDNPDTINPLPDNPDSEPDIPNPDPGVSDPEPQEIPSGISGSVNGIRYQYTGDLRFTTHGDMRSINAVNNIDDAESWTIALIGPQEGTYNCNPDATVITLARGITMLDTNADTGSCSITVMSSDSIGMEGVFTATLIDVNDETPFEVTDGTFRVVFEDAILDLDQDGISDAEDNCPFDANPDQLDDDLNRIGNICES